MIARQADVLVHVEGNDILEGNLAGLNEADEVLVGRNGRRPRRKTKDEFLLGCGCELIDTTRDVVTDVFAHSSGIISNDEACEWLVEVRRNELDNILTHSNERMDQQREEGS